MDILSSGLNDFSIKTAGATGWLMGLPGRCRPSVGQSGKRSGMASGVCGQGCPSFDFGVFTDI